jgi:hypothetical protein
MSDHHDMTEGNWTEEPAWDEYQWERFLQEQDRRAERYMNLMDRYQGHPDRDNMVAREMGWDHLIKECSDPEPDCASCDMKWRCAYFQNYVESGSEDVAPPAAAAFLDEVLGVEEGAAAASPPWDDDDDEALREDGYDPEAFQHDPLYQDAFGLGVWLHHLLEEKPALRANAAAARLVSTAHLVSAKIAAAIGDGEFDELGMTIAYLKRALRACNISLTNLEEAARAKILSTADRLECRRRIFAVRDGIVILVGECREEWRHRHGNA